MKKGREISKRWTVMLLTACLVFNILPASVYAADTASEIHASIVGLTTEYLTNPIGIDADSIHFGWKMESKVVGAKQTAYEISVYESGNPKTLVWDSGKTNSDESVGIVYGGEALEEAVAYTWSVTVWNEKGEKIFSEPASFETGVTNQENWKNAKFIRMNKSSIAPVFRTEQPLSQGNILSARLYITAIGAYQAYVNGSQVGKIEGDGMVYHHMNPGYGNRNISLGYETYDVTSCLQGSTAAAVAVIAGTGWSDGQGSSIMGQTSSQPAVKAMLTVTYDTGEQQVIATNTTDWKGTLDGPITSNGVYYGEDYDARKAKALGDFTKTGYDDSSWTNAAQQTEPSGNPVIVNAFEPQTAKYVRLSVTETGPAVKNDNENRLQIMELELLDATGNNAARNVSAAVSDNFEAGDQWKSSNLTDGDNGVNSRKGYTSNTLGYGQTSFTLGTPITIDFTFANPVTIQTLKIYPRTELESISGTECVNYPKKYELQVSNDGLNWTTAGAYEVNNLKNTVIYTESMSSAAYSGEIRPQPGTAGKILDEYEKKPVSAVLYTGESGQSEYPAGEIAVDAYYAYEESEDFLYRENYIPVGSGREIFSDGITLKKGQSMVIDMGQNMTAIPNIEFEAAEGTTLTMNFGEMLNDGSASGSGATQADGPKGSIYKKSLRTARSAVQYTFSGDGREEYQTTMSFFGYQYIGITATEDVTIYAVRSRALSSVSEQTGNIQTNNENVNKLFSNTLYGQLSNYFTTSTDCPQRDERTFWSGDTQAFARTALYNFDATPFLGDLMDIMSENTMIKGYTPAVVDDLTGYFSNWAAGWSDAQVIVPWTLYCQTGDQTVLTKYWEAMVYYMDYLKSKERGENQAPIAGGGMNFGDWLSFQGTSVEVISDYYYGYVTRLMEKIAGIIGDAEKETYYNQLFEAIKSKFLNTHVTFTNGNLVIKSGTGNTGYQFHYNYGKGGKWEDNSQTALLWMLKLGFYDSEEMKEESARLLVENIKNKNPLSASIRSEYGENTLAVGFLGSNVITPVLTDIGYSDVSYDLLLQDEQPSWLFEVKAGATTIWERWNSYTPGVGFGDSEMNSFNHYAYGSVVEWMYQYMAGISADEENPGFKNIVLQPMIDTGVQYNEEERIDSVDGSYESYYGKIESGWRSQKGELKSYDTVVPANTTAVLYLPVTRENMKGFEPVSGITHVGMTEHNGKTAAEFQLASGGYHFEVVNGQLQAELSADSEIEIEKIELNKKTHTMKKGQTFTFEVIYTPSYVTDKTLTWNSSNKAVAIVDSKGKVTAMQAGNTTITAKTANNKSASCIITVEAIKITQLKFKTSKKSLNIKKTYTQKAAVLPADATNQVLTYTSSNQKVATVNAKTGLVKAISPGIAKITAAATDGSKKTASYTIEVKPAKVTSLKVKSQKSKTAVVTWKRLSNVTGYEIQWSVNSAKKGFNKKKTIGKNKTVKFTKTKLNGGKKVHFRVRAYKKVGNKKIYGAYSKVGSVTVKR